jgi:hypothetical protein
VAEQVRALELLDQGGHAAVGRDVGVVDLGEVAAEDDLRVAAHAGEDDLQGGKLQVLGLVDDDELVGDRPPPQIGHGGQLQFSSIEQLLDSRLGAVGTAVREEGVEVVVDRRHPRGQLLGQVAGEEADLLAAHRHQRAVDAHPSVAPLLEHLLERGGESEEGLAGAGVAHHRDGGDIGVEEMMEGDCLRQVLRLDAEGAHVGRYPLQGGGRT